MVQRILSLRAVCKGCGVKFVPKSKKQKYHNEDCREEYYKKTYFPQTVADKNCLNCGEPFSTTQPKKQVYCTPECREDAQAKREEAKKASTTAERVTHFAERISAFEHDKYKCTVCGKGPKDGAVLDVVEENAKLKTVCTDCKIGKEEHNVSKS